jgi:hypothetical protein
MVTMKLPCKVGFGFSSPFPNSTQIGDHYPHLLWKPAHFSDFESPWKKDFRKKGYLLTSHVLV